MEPERISTRRNRVTEVHREIHGSVYLLISVSLCWNLSPGKKGTLIIMIMMIRAEVKPVHWSLAFQLIWGSDGTRKISTRRNRATEIHREIHGSVYLLISVSLCWNLSPGRKGTLIIMILIIRADLNHLKNLRSCNSFYETDCIKFIAWPLDRKII